MSNLYSRIANPVNTPQSEPVPGRETEMVPNSAGGFTFALDKWGMLDRFLILGSEGGTYYATERKLTLDNLSNLRACIAEDGPRVVDRILGIDRENRAPKMAPSLFALAACHTLGDQDTKTAVYIALPVMLRTGTQLFMYLSNLKALGSKLGRAKRTALAAVLNSMPPDKLAYQMMKYANREGWTWRDALRVIHPRPVDLEHDALFCYAVHGLEGDHSALLPELVHAAEEAKTASEGRLVELIQGYDLTWEMIPTERQSPVILAALAEKMPATALLRQLARLTSAGILPMFSALGVTIADRISDSEWLRKSRIHPIQILSALTVYRSGHGVRGKLTWSPNPKIVEALEAAFYTSFKHVEPTGKSTMLALDVSASMGWEMLAGVPGLTPAMGAACLAMVTLRSEPHAAVVAFSSGSSLKDLGITSVDSIESAMMKTNRATAGGTDCAIPALAALTNKLSVEAFVILTDNETWAGLMHPYIALEKYRKASGIAARQIVVGMTSTGFTIADPKDPLSLDVVGFDSAAPAVMADFIRG